MLFAIAKQAGVDVTVEKPAAALLVLPENPVTCGFGVALDQREDPFEPLRKMVPEPKFAL